MSKLLGLATMGAMMLGGIVATVSTPAAVLGPNAVRCTQRSQPAMLVKVLGLKSRTGLVRVQSYGGDPARFFEKGSWIDRVELPTPAAGPVEVCMPVPRSGVYAVSVRHDTNGTGHSDLNDGGGMSGNPKLSLFDVALKRRPDPAKVSVHVGNGVTVVSVVINYVSGGSLRPGSAS